MPYLFTIHKSYQQIFIDFFIVLTCVRKIAAGNLLNEIDQGILEIFDSVFSDMPRYFMYGNCTEKYLRNWKIIIDYYVCRT